MLDMVEGVRRTIDGVTVFNVWQQCWAPVYLRNLPCEGLTRFRGDFLQLFSLEALCSTCFNFFAISARDHAGGGIL